MSDGKVIGSRFEIGALIGQGGMGDVYLGVDQLMGAPVAIKLLKPEILIDDPSLVERFDREGEALRRLNHPNIVKMLATLNEEGQHYLVMEYVGGGSLRELLEETPQLPVERVLNMALDLADALTRAHRLKIIHRDIKPANVLIAEDGTPRLSDFGVAQMGDRTRVTQSGSLIGTYAYISPEGCMSEDLDERADIWSFGVMLYEMLAGQRPFEGSAPAAVLTAILNKPIPDLLQYRPDAPAALVGLIYSMLEKARDERISSIRLVGAQLEAFIKGSDTAIERMAVLFSQPDDAVTVAPAQNPALTSPPDPLSTSGEGEKYPHSPTPTRSSHGEAWQGRGGEKMPRENASLGRKRVTGGPRIFISYRREDSIAVTGRIYDRLVAAFGEQYIFKDVDKIPVGANFKTILENEVRSCDVLLTVIGQHWLTIHDQEGHRRLDDPNDFVRIEVAAGLQRGDILVVPALVNEAMMPEADDLPPDLTDLAFRNAAVVRNDPDFNRDVSRLIEQIKDSFEIATAEKVVQGRRLRWAWIGAALGMLLVVMAALVGLPRAVTPDLTASASVSTNMSGEGTIEKQPTDAATSNQVVIEPVGAGELMVLVADLEALGEARDVSRFIVRDLTRKLEEEVPFSQVRVRRWPEVIRSDAEAQAAAEAAGATVMIWGNYTANLIELEVQVGSLSAFPNLAFERDLLERTANVTVEMTDERRQSAVTNVLGVLAVLQMVSDNAYETMRTLALQEEIGAPGLDIQGGGVAAQMHRYLEVYNELEAAIAETDAAIALDPGNPLLYISRGVAHQRNGDSQAALQDASSAARRGPEGWVMPLYIRGNVAQARGDWDEAIAQYNQIIEQQPANWFPHNMRGWFHYLKGEYDQAVADYGRALELNPNANFPYIVSSLIALRQGRMADARTYFDTILRDFPDPSFGNRLIRVAFGTPENDLVGPLFSAVGHFILEQYDAMLTDTQKALEVVGENADLYAMEGFAYCNLGRYGEAEAAYNRAIALEPDSPFVYLLRADARLKQLNLLGANADAGKVRELIAASRASEEMLPYLDAGLRLEVGCQNFFRWEPARQ